MAPERERPKSLLAWRRPTRRALVVAALFSALLWSPAFEDLAALGYGDWGWFHHQWEAARVAVSRYHEWPLWDPFHCGGVSLWGNPQLQVLSPTWALTGLLFGTAIGHKLYVVLHCVAGVAGAYVLARSDVRLSPRAAAFAACTFAASGFFAWHVAGGHSSFLCFYFAPGMLHAWRRASVDLRWTVPVALGMALMLSEGGHYAVPFIALLLGVDALVRIVTFDAPLRVIGAALLSGVLAALLGAYRFVPILLALREYPRPGADADHLTLGELLVILTEDHHAGGWTFAGHTWAWAEYAAFVGPGVVLLAMIGGWLALRTHRRRIVLVPGIVFGLLTMGRFAEWSPWALLQRMPVFDTVHVPSRFRGLFTLYLALLAGIALDDLARACESVRWGRLTRPILIAMPWTFALLALAHVLAANLPVIDKWHSRPLPVDAEVERHHLIGRAGYIEQYMTYPERNVGTRQCYDPLPWRVSRALWEGDGPQVRIAPASAGEVVSEARTTMTLWAEVELREPARVVFNQNAARGWIAMVGNVVEDRGLFAVELPAGHHRIHARFAPPELPWVVAALILGLVLCGAVLRYGAPRGRTKHPRNGPPAPPPQPELHDEPVGEAPASL